MSEIHQTLDLVLGIENIFKLEGIINSRKSYLSFLNRSVPFFLKEDVILKPRKQKFIKKEVPFIDEISGLVLVKLLQKMHRNTLVLKLMFVKNSVN